MNYAYLLMGLIAGAAIGGAVVAGTGTTLSGVPVSDAEAIKKIVREVISEEPKLILESVQKLQQGEQAKRAEDASAALKDSATKTALYNDTHVGAVGPANSKRVVVEFFDYNCPACKMQAQQVEALVKKDSGVRVLLREYPIFGEASEANSRIGLAVVELAPEKYFAFYQKMHARRGRASEADALAIVKELGLDVEKVKQTAAKPEMNARLEENRKLGEVLHIQGTPTLVVGDEVIPHAAEADEILKSFK